MGDNWVFYIDGIGAGIYILFGLSRLDLWRRRPRRPAHLWLGAIAFSALLVNVTGLLLRGPGEGSPPLVVSLNLLGVAGVTLSVLELVWCLARFTPSRGLRVLEAAILLVAALAGMWGGFGEITEVFSAVLLVVALGTGVRATIKGDAESRLLLVGVVVLVTCLVLDILGNLGFLPLVPGIPVVGFLVLFLMAAHAVNLRLQQEETASRTDALTGVLNRRGFLELAQLAVSLSDRSRRPLTVIMLDLDHFKRINDTLGHSGGDAVLQEVASVLTGAVREQDLVARWGGDELILLLPDTGAEGGTRVARKILTTIRGRAIDIGGGPVSLTVSVGVAERLPEEPVAQTIQRVDHALYRAKEAGRNRMVLDEAGNRRSEGPQSDRTRL